MAMVHQTTASSDQPTNVHSRSGDIRLCQDEVHVCSSSQLKPPTPRRRWSATAFAHSTQTPAALSKNQTTAAVARGGGLAANAFASDRFTDGARQYDRRPWQQETGRATIRDLRERLEKLLEPHVVMAKQIPFTNSSAVATARMPSARSPT